MTNFQSRSDLESSARGEKVFSYPPNYVPSGKDVMQEQVSNLVLIYLKQIADVLVESKELIRKSRNLLWQIDEKLSNPQNEPEYDTEEQGDAN